MHRVVKLKNKAIFTVVAFVCMALQFVELPYECAYEHAMEKRPELVQTIKSYCDEEDDMGKADLQGILSTLEKVSRLPQTNVIKLSQIAFTNSVECLVFLKDSAKSVDIYKEYVNDTTDISDDEYHTFVTSLPVNIADASMLKKKVADLQDFTGYLLTISAFMGLITVIGVFGTLRVLSWIVAILLYRTKYKTWPAFIW